MEQVTIKEYIKRKNLEERLIEKDYETFKDIDDVWYARRYSEKGIKKFNYPVYPDRKELKAHGVFLPYNLKETKEYLISLYPRSKKEISKMTKKQAYSTLKLILWYTALCQEKYLDPSGGFSIWD